MKNKNLKPLNQLFTPGTTRLGKQISFAFTTIGTTLTSVAVMVELSKWVVILSAALTIAGAIIGNLMKKDEEI